MNHRILETKSLTIIYLQYNLLQNRVILFRSVGQVQAISIWYFLLEFKESISINKHTDEAGSSACGYFLAKEGRVPIR